MIKRVAVDEKRCALEQRIVQQVSILQNDGTVKTAIKCEFHKTTHNLRTDKAKPKISRATKKIFPSHPDHPHWCESCEF